MAALVAVFGIAAYMVIAGTPAIREIGIAEFLFGTQWRPTAEDPSFGILYIILTSVVGTGLSVLLGVPVALMTAVFLAELAPKRLYQLVRPAVELLARVPLENIEYVADLGCGPGNSTALLHQRWPAARITGIDSSPAMIAEARSALPDCQFVEADIRNWQPEQALDLIFANASLQWLPDHYELFPHLVSLLNPQGVLAVQMPDNWLEPTHVLMREVAWEQNYPDRGREPLAGVHAYYDILSEAGCEVDIWRTTYYHQMPSHQAIIDWVTATGLRPWLQDLTESEQQLFLKRYHQMLEEQYPLQENGQILLAFPRLFIVARRME